MTSIKLSKIPDLTPIKMTIAVLPELHQMLGDYADLYRATYGAQVAVADLVPHMLAAFLASDRAFAKHRALPDAAGGGMPS
ncbi:DUF2274 domain-containing protein [Sphingomonas oryzagri]|uniref:DUF2274 domain-containing protein n=1 Tax=Sphingomonas oryzagri TaxID=3042314 RepID=A0ABT6MZ60_9SPHN|nr:DUF2274 domain-containing protein [Sphingomonas oryzagri]MDH7638087.1 DUF2274 domain-containing protein [Sphingomonas oryzagri]